MSSHQRFLITGVKVGLEATDPCVSCTKERFNSIEKVSETVPSRPMSKRGAMVSFTGESKELLPEQFCGNGTLATNKVPVTGDTSLGDILEWRLDEYLGLAGFSQNYGVMDSVSSTVCFLLLFQFFHALTLKGSGPCLASKNKNMRFF